MHGGEQKMPIVYRQAARKQSQKVLYLSLAYCFLQSSPVRKVIFSPLEIYISPIYLPNSIAQSLFLMDSVN